MSHSTFDLYLLSINTSPIFIAPLSKKHKTLRSDDMTRPKLLSMAILRNSSQQTSSEMIARTPLSILYLKPSLSIKTPQSSSLFLLLTGIK